jgi:hypothetical protein
MNIATKILRTTLLATLLGVTATSCGGGEWLDTGVGECDELTNDAEGRAAAEEWAFPQMCEGSLGKSYADEWRCTSGKVEIKCK